MRPKKKTKVFMTFAFFLKYVDNNDTVSYGCIGAATLGEKNATLVKGVRQIGIYRFIE